MPFRSPEQEIWMRINKPTLWRKWKKKYGSTPQLNSFLEKEGRRKRKINRSRKKRRVY